MIILKSNTKQTNKTHTHTHTHTRFYCYQCLLLYAVFLNGIESAQFLFIVCLYLYSRWGPNYQDRGEGSH